MAMAQTMKAHGQADRQYYKLLSGHTIPSIGLGTWRAGEQTCQAVCTALTEVQIMNILFSISLFYSPNYLNYPVDRICDSGEQLLLSFCKAWSLKKKKKKERFRVHYNLLGRPNGPNKVRPSLYGFVGP